MRPKLHKHLGLYHRQFGVIWKRSEKRSRILLPLAFVPLKDLCGNFIWHERQRSGRNGTTEQGAEHPTDVTVEVPMERPHALDVFGLEIGVIIPAFVGR